MSETIEGVDSWAALMNVYQERFMDGQWCFRGGRTRGRGVPVGEHEFKTSLERVAVDRWERPWEELPEIEEGLLRRFKREAHLYLRHEPEPDDYIGWLALMRHHGAPTRLLDWTYSFFVAAYFAVDRVKPGDRPLVWALDTATLWERLEAMPHLAHHLRGDPNADRPETVGAIIDHSPRIPLVFPLNPLRMNRRLILQQSVFLVPGDITRSFMENYHAVDEGEEMLVRISLSRERSFWEEATRQLLAMNISSATLFPNLDGFARNLRALIPYPELRATDTEAGRE